MRIKLLSFLVMFFAVCVSGCVENSNESVLPQPGLLAQEFSTFQPPVKPMEIEEPLAIAEPAGIITLRDGLAFALMHNPELKVFSWDVRIAEARQLQAVLWPNPKLGIEVEEAGGPGARSGFDAAETTIALSQLIEMGDKSGKRKKVALLETKLAGWDYEAKRLDVFSEVTKAFIEVLAAQQRLKLNKELLQLSEELVATVSKRVDAGKDSLLEKTKAGVAHSNVKIEYRQAGQNLEFARRQLAATWAGREPKFDGVAGKLDSPAAIPSIGELINLMEQNPDIARLTLEIDKGRAVLELEKARAISDITISGGMQRFNETDNNAVVFGISFPLGVSDRNQAGKLEASYALAKAREEQRAAHTRIQTKLAKAYQRLSNSYSEVTELEKNILQGAESVFEASKTGYSQGKQDYLHVLDAQRTLFEAKAQYIDALASFHIAKTDVERLVGRPIESVNISINEDSK